MTDKTVNYSAQPSDVSVYTKVISWELTYRQDKGSFFVTWIFFSVCKLIAGSSADYAVEKPASIEKKNQRRTNLWTPSFPVLYSHAQDWFLHNRP